MSTEFLTSDAVLTAESTESFMPDTDSFNVEISSVFAFTLDSRSVFEFSKTAIFSEIGEIFSFVSAEILSLRAAVHSAEGSIALSSTV